jgi:hypothetical protein
MVKQAIEEIASSPADLQSAMLLLTPNSLVISEK